MVMLNWLMTGGIFSSRSSVAAWFLSMVMLNWLMAGGIFRRISMIFFMRCNRMYLGHRTKRVKSRFGWMSPPRRKFLGVFSNSGFLCALFFFSASGADGSFFLPAADFAALPMAAATAACGAEVPLRGLLGEGL